MLDMVEPVGRLDQRRALADHRIGQASAVLRRAIADHLLRAGPAARASCARLLLVLDPPAPGRRRLAIFALERAVERRLAVEADGIGDVGGVVLAVAQHVGGHPHPPPRAITHRRLAEQLDEALAEHGARHACLARESLDVELFGVAPVDDRQRLRHRRVGEPAQPARSRRPAARRHNRGSPGQEQLGQPRDHFRRRVLLGEEAHRAVEPSRFPADDRRASAAAAARRARGWSLVSPFPGSRTRLRPWRRRCPVETRWTPSAVIQPISLDIGRAEARFGLRADAGRCAAGWRCARRRGVTGGMPVDLDDQLARPDIMIADQLSRASGRRARNGRGVNSAATQKSPLNSPSITTPPVRRSDPRMSVRTSISGPACAYVSGVSVNLSGKRGHFGKRAARLETARHIAGTNLALRQALLPKTGTVCAVKNRRGNEM